MEVDVQLYIDRCSFCVEIQVVVPVYLLIALSYVSSLFTFPSQLATNVEFSAPSYPWNVRGSKTSVS